MRDLPRWVEAHYPARRDRGGRAVAGLSMGGFGAMRFALAAPDRYAAAASLSGAIWQNVPRAALDLPAADLKLIADSAAFHRIDADTLTPGPVVTTLVSHFSGAFGTPFEARIFNRNNVFTMLESRRAEGVELPARGGRRRWLRALTPRHRPLRDPARRRPPRGSAHHRRRPTSGRCGSGRSGRLSASSTRISLRPPDPSAGAERGG